ncbi:MAG: hypothetical protein LBQ61_00965 [Spirochaetales bacterium]|jgi:hypothetical protein|nr:hypothetical protein [Spirochaetales bacterium]
MKKVFILCFAVLGTAMINAQSSLSLNEALADAAGFFSSRLPQGSAAVISGIETETRELSDFIIQEFSLSLSGLGVLQVAQAPGTVEPSPPEIPDGTFENPIPGTVSEAETVSLSPEERPGPRFVFSGFLIPDRDGYRLWIQAIDAATGQIAGTRTLSVHHDSTLAGLGVLRADPPRPEVFEDGIDPADAWKHNWIYVGVSAGYSIMSPGAKNLRVDDPNDAPLYGRRGNPLDDTYPPIGAAVYALLQPFDHFGIALDIGGSWYWSATISIAPTLILRFNQFEVDAFLGLGLSQTAKSNLGFIGGVRGGMHLGPGLMFLEVRPMAFFLGNTALDTNITLGYQMGFFPRKQ